MKAEEAREILGVEVSELPGAACCPRGRRAGSRAGHGHCTGRTTRPAESHSLALCRMEMISSLFARRTSVPRWSGAFPAPLGRLRFANPARLPADAFVVQARSIKPVDSCTVCVARCAGRGGPPAGSPGGMLAVKDAELRKRQAHARACASASTCGICAPLRGRALLVRPRARARPRSSPSTFKRHRHGEHPSRVPPPPPATPARPQAPRQEPRSVARGVRGPHEGHQRGIQEAGAPGER